MSLPASAVSCLQHLQRSFPHSAYSISTYKGDSNETLYVLKRGGLSIARQGCKVLTLRSSDNAILADGVVILNGDGTLPPARPPVIRPAVPIPAPAAATDTFSGFHAGVSDASNVISNCFKELYATVSDPNFSNSKHYTFFLICVGIFFATIAKVVLKLLTLRVFCLLIPLFLALRATAPPNESFDVRKELKRVLRKELAPPAPPPARPAVRTGFGFDPLKWFKDGATKAVASVVGETTAALGYDLQIMDYLGAVKVATVKFQAMGEKDCIWVGVFNKWYFMGAIKEDDVAPSQMNQRGR